MNATDLAPKFELGQIVMTQGVAGTIREISQEYGFEHGIPMTSVMLCRHQGGDWGEVPEEDRKANDAALVTGERVLSAYTMFDRRFWVITEWDRSATTILLPEEY